MLRLLIISILLFSIQSWANISAKRDKNQDYKELITSNISFDQSDSALNLAGPLKDLNPNSVVEWESTTVMQERFEMIRDERFIEIENTKRRISWLYPDDGCFARAAKFINKADEKNFAKPQRIFIFGNLTVKTDNHPNGEVSWWYHTAPIVRIADQVYVLDAAINPSAPLRVEDWILTQVDKIEDAKISYCSPHSHVPYSTCVDADESTDDVADSQQLTYLNYEWGRQETLGRDPEEVLGENPPWLKLLREFL